MAYFPLFLDLDRKTVLVVGGGPVAARKARVLLDYGPCVRVCAPAFVPELEALPGAELVRQEFSPELLEGVSLAVAATGDRKVNRTIGELCRSRSIPVDVADSREESTFLFPAVIRRGRLSVGISTGGSSPAACAYMRRELEQALPSSLEPILDWLEGLREEVKGTFPKRERRARFARLSAAALEAGRPLSPDETWAILPAPIPSQEEEHG